MKRELCASDKLKIERELLSQGFKTIAGVDEVGRGPLAGGAQKPAAGGFLAGAN